MKEDCLYLNVWAPAENKGEKLPVLYWIHGGGFVMGAASQPIYDGEELARLGCVVVSINYRLGPLGFLAHPALSAESADKISGNYGLLDQIQGLRWVKKNVAAFGGDPERVTIFGESAGGISVLCLMVTPETRGLFHGAIAQSATGMLLPRLRDPHPGVESAEQAGQKLMSACGLKEEADAGQMRKLSVEALLAPMPSEMSTGSALHLKPRAMLLGPIVDGHVIPDMPNLIFASGHEHEVPLIVGNTKDEMSLMLMGNKMPADEAAYVKQLQEDFGESADGLAKAYPVREQKDIRVAVIQLASDATFIKESRFIARTHATAKQKTYRYEFAHGTKQGFLRALGAHHGSELAFVFQRPAGRNDPVDMKLALAMGRYWVNFAASGNPNGSDLPRWPAYQTDSEETIVFGENVDVAKGPRNAQLDEIEKALPSQNP
jgi:para-nitrobenzyl esterase